MATSITMPKLGLTMTEGTISKWLKKEGDPVAAGDTLFTVSTDKLTYDYQSETAGTLLKISLKENETVAVGGEVAIIGEAGEIFNTAPAAPAGMDAGAPPSVESTERQAPRAAAEKTPAPGQAAYATPKARAFARSRGIDLSRLSGRGEPPMVFYADIKAYADAHTVNATPKARAAAREKGLDLALLTGRGEPPIIHASDVEEWLREHRVKSSPLAARMSADLGVDMAALGVSGRVMSSDVMKAAGIAPQAAAESPAPSSPARSEAAPTSGEKPMSRMRQIIAERMTESATKIPTVNYQTDVDCTALKAMRNLLKSSVKISFNDIIMKACAQVLMEMPMTNCTTDMERKRYIMHDYANIGLAVAVDGGLLVPNVKNVQAKGLKEIAGDSAAIVEKARKGTLTPDDMSGGTFTISTLGMFGIRHFTPIINPPESCILGVTMIEDRAAVQDGQIVIRPMSTFCLTADHRAVDGADAAQFLQRLKALLENPCLMLL